MPQISKKKVSALEIAFPINKDEQAKLLIEIEAQVILKGTRVDGIYTADPLKDPNAVKYNRISFDDVYEKGLKIMDLTAFTLCKENDLPIVVFDMDTPGTLKRIMDGEELGTIVQNETTELVK